jgi:hypothetical protein
VANECSIDRGQVVIVLKHSAAGNLGAELDVLASWAKEHREGEKVLVLEVRGGWILVGKRLMAKIEKLDEIFVIA